MQVIIRYGAQLATAAGVDEETLDLNPGADLRSALRLLADRHGPEFARFLYDASGRVHHSLLAAVDDRQVDKEARAPLRDGAEILLITPMAGG